MFSKTIAHISADLKKKKYSSVELTQDYLKRIHEHKHLNAFITVCDEHALSAAKKADARIHAGETNPLLGVPIAQKDILCTQGIKTTCGSKILDNFIAPYDATLVNHFNNAGAVMLGKTNMDEFAMGSSNETSFYGPVKNPWDVTTVPGGSSGGSSAAVAARLVPGATGTDTGGSIRQPAALCGITGLKPTYGRVSRYGLIAYASSLDQAGPMAITAEDCAIMMNAIGVFDPRDSTSINKPTPDYTADLNKNIRGLKIGLPKEYFQEGLDPEVAKTIETAIAEFKKLGATFTEISLPNAHLAVPTYYVLSPAECSSNLARYDGIRYGHRCDHPKDLLDLYKRSRAEGFGSEVKRRIMVGTYVLSSGHSDAYYMKAQKTRHLIADDFNRAFKEVDLILGPTTPTPAFKLGAKSNDPVSMYLSDIYTIAVNLAGLPGISIPVGFVKGLPVGMQLIGNHFTESLILQASHQYQQVTDWHLQEPTIKSES